MFHPSAIRRIQIITILLLVITQLSWMPVPIAISNYLKQYSYDWDREWDCVAYKISEMMERKSGVCLDFSYLTAYLLDTHGIRPYEVTYHITREDVHAITVFEWRGKWWAYSNMDMWGGYDAFDEVFESRGSYMVNGVTRNYCLKK